MNAKKTTPKKNTRAVAPHMKKVGGELVWVEKGVWMSAPFNSDGTVDWGGVAEIEIESAEPSFLRKVAAKFKGNPYLKPILEEIRNPS